MIRLLTTYLPLVWYTLGLTAIVFLVGLGIGNEPIFGVSLMSLGLGSLILVAIWSVLGRGNYFLRLAGSHTVGLLPVFGGLLGFSIAMGRYFSTDDMGYATIFTLLSILPLSVAAQTPYWIMRACFGWQIVPSNTPPVHAISIREIFLLTLVCAIAITSAQFSANLSARISSANAYDERDYLPDETISLPVEQPDGTIVFEEQLATTNSIAAARNQMEQQMRVMVLSVYATYAGVVFVISLLSVPVVRFVFGSKETASGCALTFVYGFGLGAVTIGIIAGVFGGPPNIGGLTGYVAWAVGLIVGSIAIGLSILRLNSFTLTSPKRFRQEEAARSAITTTTSPADIDEDDSAESSPLDPQN